MAALNEESEGREKISEEKKKKTENSWGNEKGSFLDKSNSRHREHRGSTLC